MPMLTTLRKPEPSFPLTSLDLGKCKARCFQKEIGKREERKRKKPRTNLFCLEHLLCARYPCLSTYCVPGTLLGASVPYPTSFSYVPHKVGIFEPHFTDKTEAQRFHGRSNLSIQLRRSRNSNSNTTSCLCHLCPSLLTESLQLSNSSFSVHFLINQNICICQSDLGPA